MGQSLEVNVKTTSDVPDALNKAKTATADFGKQVETISKKFSNSFKDIFISFAAPLVLLNRIIGDIDAAIQRNRDNMRKGMEDISSGDNKVATEQERIMARFLMERAKSKQAATETAAGREAIAGQYVDQNQLDFLLNKPVSFFAGLMGELGIGKGFGYQFVQQAAAERFNANNPEEVKAQAEANAKAAQAEAMNKSPTSFKTPEGFGNVVGVGANPVIEAMTLQLEEARKQTLLLEAISQSSNGGGGVPVDFTKSPTPSRASLLKGY
jgi:hypothetical protein